MGLETELEVKPTRRLSVRAAATLSSNKVEDFTEYIDNWDYWSQDFENTPPEELEPLQFAVAQEGETDLAFSPGLTTSGQIDYTIVDAKAHRLSLSWMTKYVGEQYLDNTGRDASLLENYTYTDVGVNYQFKWRGKRSLQANLLVRNLFDARFESNGWIYRFRSRDFDPRATDPYSTLEGGDIYHLKGLFPQAGRNILLGLTIAI